MSRPQRKFSIFYHVFVGMFIIGTAFLPLFAAEVFSEEIPVPPIAWIISCGWALMMAIIYWYVSWRCSSEELTFYEGLLFVAYSMAAMTPNFSFFFVMPSLLFVFLSSVFFALRGDIARDAGYAKMRFYRLVTRFYKNRMRQ
jgi:hypothetical protein